MRTIAAVVPAQRTSDGAGVVLYRSMGSQRLESLDPFLLFDEFKSERGDDYIAGFPDHPHRGFETVTYMLEGCMEHRDNHGNRGLLGPGSVQWMTAGRGIIHSEMPQQQDGMMWGFQLWVNLPGRDKMQAPRYQYIAAELIPEVAVAGGRVRVVAGNFGGVTGPVSGIATEPCYWDVHADASSDLNFVLPQTHNAFCYAYRGSVMIAGQALETQRLAVLSSGNDLKVTPQAGARFLIIAGRPLNEPVARYGPFVMNTPDQIRQAVADYQAGLF